MIITADDIRSVRPVAQNIQDFARIEPYINEVEEMYAIPQLGAKTYKAICESSEAWVEQLKNGGFYNDDNSYFAGLKSAIAYLAYSRMVRNQNINVTAFGVVFKNGEHSERTDDAIIARISNEAQDIGLKHLHGCVAYLQHIGVMPKCTPRLGKARIKVIG